MVKARLITALSMLGALTGVIAAVTSASGRSVGTALAQGATTCPAHYHRPHFADYPALHRVMVPRKPTRMVICRYASVNAKDPQALQGSGVIRRGKQIHRVVRRYNRLPEPSSGPTTCPADDGSRFTLKFRYRHRPKALVRQDASGCRFGTNGHRTVTALNKRGNRLLRLLRRLSAA